MATWLLGGPELPETDLSFITPAPFGPGKKYRRDFRGLDPTERWLLTAPASAQSCFTLPLVVLCSWEAHRTPLSPQHAPKGSKSCMEMPHCRRQWHLSQEDALGTSPWQPAFARGVDHLERISLSLPKHQFKTHSLCYSTVLGIAGEAANYLPLGRHHLNHQG